MDFFPLLFVQGKLSEAWATVTKGAIAEAVLSLTKLDEARRQPAECIKTHTVSPPQSLGTKLD